MSKDFSETDVLDIKLRAQKRIDNLLTELINSKNFKKASLVSYWLKDYASYISYEDEFQPSKNISYSRGDIVQVNFGFNIKSELGGRHYAVVIDKNNHHNSDSITVIPLTSIKPNTIIRPNNVNLGSEFYEKISAKASKLMATLTSDHTDLQQLLALYKQEQGNAASQLLTELNKKLAAVEKNIKMVNKYINGLSGMKYGSIAKIEQIRTISKMRIINPKNSIDTLYKIRFSNTAMDKINEKLKELYIF
ncbi:MAG TPA: type II toxin-antitoxin system PemK/MazF family toxin [Lachnospiraceae bacterium]